MPTFINERFINELIHNYTIFKSPMNKPVDFVSLLQPEVQLFIKENEQTDEKSMVLRHHEILGVPSALIAQQIVGRRKAKGKLSLFYNTPNIIYPPKLNLEQCSSEITAKFKSEIISGQTAIDLTGGFGADSFSLSKKFKRLIHIEKNEELLKMVKHNHRVLGASNIEHVHQDAEAYLSAHADVYDLIYIDPSRRSVSNKKVFRFADSSPNMVSLLPTLLERSRSILIKASPLLDIKEGIKELGQVSKVFVVGYSNECKEILFLVQPHTKEPTVEAVDLSDVGSAENTFTFEFAEEARADALYDEPREYVYEPSAMILKAGAFKLIASRFDLKKIAPNTHLYTSDKIQSDFPGKVFSIESHLKSDAKSIAKFLPKGYANVATRNYPLTPQQLKIKLRVKDGGDQFIIGFSGIKKKYLILANRVK